MASAKRGLGSLLGGAASPPAQPDRSPLKLIPVDQISPNRHQPRRHFDEDGLQSLAANMKANGLLQPVLVRQGAAGYELIAGERRWRAAKLAGLATVPAIEQIADDARSLELALVENVLRDDLNPIELASAYKDLCQASSLTQEQVADRVGRSRTSVTNTIRLLDLPDAIQDMIRAGHLTPGHGRALLAVKPPKRQLDLAARTVADALSVRQLEHLVYRAPTKRESASQTVALKAPHIRQIEDALSERFGTKVTVHAEKKRRRGRIIIEFYTNDDFERILQTVGLGPGGD